jgi:hypothetical protein
MSRKPNGCGRWKDENAKLKKLLADAILDNLMLSHKVIRNLIDETIDAADRQGLNFNICQKAEKFEQQQGRLRFAKNSEDLLTALGPNVPGRCSAGPEGRGMDSPSSFAVWRTYSDADDECDRYPLLSERQPS